MLRGNRLVVFVGLWVTFAIAFVACGYTDAELAACDGGGLARDDAGECVPTSGIR